MKKALSFILCMALVLVLFGCDGNTDIDTTTLPETTEVEAPITQKAGEPTGSQGITVGYIASDSLSPFEAKSEVNRQLMYLLHGGLFYLSSGMSPEKLYATDARLEGKTVTVDIDQKARFSDGTPLTASYVASSFSSAKSSTFYGALLKNISSCESLSEYSVRFSLYEADVLALNCLTFPIVKSESVGAGKYSLEHDENGSPYLKLNQSYPLYSLSQNNIIGLYDVGKSSSVEYAFMTGDTDTFLDTLDDFDYRSLSSKTATVSTNKLVYIGANTKGSSLSSWGWLRRVINIGLNRELVGGSPFFGQSVPAVMPFSPAFYMMTGLELNSTHGNRARAITLLEENGFSSEGSGGVRTNGRLYLKMSLLVCSDNPFKTALAKMIATDLLEMGIQINIIEKSLEEYTDALEAGSFDLYIGEINLCDNLALDEFFTKDGSVSFGIEIKSSDEDAVTVADSYFSFKHGEISMTQYVESFYTSVPFIPVCFRTSVMSFNPLFSEVESMHSDMYASVYSWVTD